MDTTETAPTFEEQLLIKAYQDMLREMRQVGEEAAEGTVLDSLEGMVMGKGRDLLRRSLQTQLQAAAETAEKKGARSVRLAKRRGATKGRTSEKL